MSLSLVGISIVKKKFLKNFIELTEELLKYINSIDFSLFSHKTPLELIKSLEGSMSFASIFGGGLKKKRCSYGL